jgi:aldose 1-epimerase
MLTLTSRNCRLLLAPQAGATLVAAHWTGAGVPRPLLHTPSGATAGTTAPNRFGCWPMVPFCNRAFGGLIRLDGEDVAVPVNDPAAGGNIHGFGWQANWTVAEATQDSARLVHEARGAGPYSYDAQLLVALDDDGLSLTLHVESCAERELPYGIGFHPWFPREPGSRLALAARGVMTLGEHYRPVAFGPVPGDLRLDGSAPLPADREIVASLIDWDGTATLTFPQAGYAIDITAGKALRHPLVWAPPGADFICLEPQSHCVGAPTFAHAGAHTPLARLSHGRSLAGSMRISARPFNGTLPGTSR